MRKTDLRTAIAINLKSDHLILQIKVGTNTTNIPRLDHSDGSFHRLTNGQPLLKTIEKLSGAMVAGPTNIVKPLGPMDGWWSY